MELNALFVWFCFCFVLLNLYLRLLIPQLTPIEKYALHYLEYLHISDDESALKVP